MIEEVQVSPLGDEAPPPATAHIPLQQLLLDAAERVDRLALFTASLWLPRDTERELSRRLQRRLEKLGP